MFKIWADLDTKDWPLGKCLISPLFTPNQLLFYSFSITKSFKNILDFLENIDKLEKWNILKLQPNIITL